MAPRNNQRSTPTQRPAQRTVQTNAGPNPMGTSAQSKPTTINQGLKIAGTGGITKQELQSISDTTGRSGAQVIQRLDALNQKLKSQDQVGISLNSGAANMLIRQAQNAPITMESLYSGNKQFGTGQIGKQLQGMVGTRSAFGIKGTPGTGRMIGGTAIRPGGRQAVQGFGKQFGMPTIPPITAGTAMPTGQPTTSDGTATTTPEFLPEFLPEEEEDQQDITINMPGSPTDLASWATGYRSARSGRKRAGRQAQGLTSQRVNPTGSFRGGM